MKIDKGTNSEDLFNHAGEKDSGAKRGKLKIFFGYAAGVGKTYSMLMEAHDIKKKGKDIVIGYVEAYTRPETMELVYGIESIEPKIIDYKGIILKEFDLDKALSRKPEIILIDELAHTNVKNVRHRKRWQDIEELLDAGIDVYSTLNVQHIESLNDLVESITYISVKETVPDRIFDDADKVELIDIEPAELLKRFSDGKIYNEEQTKKAFGNFFALNNLSALREIALRRTADRVNYEVESIRLSKGQTTIIPTSNTILACIGISPSASRIIRTASRMAEAYHSKWVALYVETPKTKELNKEDKERLNAYFALAEQLGGELVTLYGNNIVEQIIDYAKFRNVFKIIIGKNHKKPYHILPIYSEDIVDKLMEYNTDIDVCIITTSLYKKKNERSFLQLTKRVNISMKEVIRSAVIISIALGIARIFDYLGFAEANIIMIFILGVLVIYMVTTGYFLGIIASIASVLMFNYFFTQPRNSFEFYNKGYYATFPMMLTVSIIIGTLTSKIQREGHNSSEREKQTQTLYRVSRKLLSATGTSDVIAIGIKYISRLLEGTVVCYLTEDNKLSTPFVYYFDRDEKDDSLLTRDEEAVAYWAYLNRKQAGAGTNTFYGAKGYYMPLRVQEKIIGIIGISCVSGTLQPEQKFIFETVVGQIAIALDREILSEIQKNTKLEIEAERLRSNLLRSISHDLRSPLTGIKGSISTIIENGDAISKERNDELLMGIYEDTEWLIRLVENLLSMTRLNDGKMKINKNMELVEEVVFEAVQRTSKRFKDHKLKVTVPENVIMVPMDGGLIEQVLINLIDNALKFTPKGSLIEIKAYEKEENVIFEVIDNGIGISEKILPYIFDRFFTNGNAISDSSRGVGLGLAICKSIVEAHGGTINAYNRVEGGTIFRFNIPKEDNDDGQ